MFKPAENVPEHLRGFIGIWISDTGYEKTGRHAMIAIIDINMGGDVTAYRALGPPGEKSSNRNPAAFSRFVGTIRERKLTLQLTLSELVATFDSQNRIEVTETYRNGLVAKVLLKPAWTLVDAERARKSD
jgi:hypothetical protein